MRASIDYEKIRGACAQLNLITEDFSLNLSRVESLILSMPVDSSGNAQVKLENKLIFIKREYEKLIYFLKTATNKLQYLSSEYEEFEDYFLSRLSGI